MYIKNTKILRITNLCSFFLQLQWLLSYQQFCVFSLNESCKTYLGPMLPPGSRNWQLISSNSLLFGGITFVALQAKQLQGDLLFLFTFEASVMNYSMFVERKVRYSALYTNLVGWHAGAVSFPLSDVILAQIACPLSDIMFCLHSGIN